VQPSPSAHALRHAGHEGDHVVLDLLLDLFDPRDVEAAWLDRARASVARCRVDEDLVAAISTSSQVAKRFSSDRGGHLGRE